MTEQEFAELAASKLTQVQAAKQLGMSFEQFRALREQFPHIRWDRKLSAEQIKAIYVDKRSNRSLAEVYGVDQSIISKIRSGRCYNRITGAPKPQKGNGNEQRAD
jgi:hypothetical protein